MADKIFTQGMVAKAPRVDFNKCSLSFRTDEFVQFLQDHTKPDGWVNVDILESDKTGKWYGQLNQWTKDAPKKEVTSEDSPF